MDGYRSCRLDTLVICDDDDLRDTLKCTLECLNCHVCALASAGETLVPMAPSGAFDLAMLCVGLCRPDTLADVEALLAFSAAMRGTTVLLGTTLSEHLLPTLPPFGRAKEVEHLSMPFDLDVLAAIVDRVSERKLRSFVATLLPYLTTVTA